MQGSILSVTGAGNQGLILGDDGARYTFAPTGWMDSSTKAASGMKVDFQPVGSQATNVRTVGGAGAAWPSSPAASGFPNQPAAPVEPTYAPAQPSQVVSQPPPVSPDPPTQAPASDAGNPPAEQNPFNRWLQSRGSLGALDIDLDLWRTTKGFLVMCLVTILLGVFLPVIGSVFGGFFGGRVADNGLQGVVAASFSIVVTAFVVITVGAGRIIPIFSLLISDLISEGIGETLPSEIIFATFLNALPILLGTLWSNWTSD